jgi:hypothetical protein
LLFPPATQTCCSEGEDRLKYFYEEFYACAAPVAIPVVLWSLLLFHFTRESS